MIRHKSLIPPNYIILLGLLFCVSNFYSQQLTVTSNGTLNFGTFTRVNGGTITMDPFGSISTTGDIFVVNSGSSRSVVTFDVSTTLGANKTVVVNAPPTALTGPGSLELNLNFDRTSFSVSKTNPQTIRMGGTLTVGPEDTPGPYSGTVTVNFVYQ